MATEQEINREAGRQAGLEVRQQTIRLLEKKGPSLDRIVLRLKQALNAKTTKAQYDKDIGGWVYAEAMIDHRIRLEAVKVALALWDANPSQKHELSTGDGEPLVVELKWPGNGNGDGNA